MKGRLPTDKAASGRMAIVTGGVRCGGGGITCGANGGVSHGRVAAYDSSRRGAEESGNAETAEESCAKESGGAEYSAEKYSLLLLPPPPPPLLLLLLPLVTPRATCSGSVGHVVGRDNCSSSCQPPFSLSHTVGWPLAPLGAMPRGFGYGPAAAARAARFVSALCGMLEGNAFGSGKALSLLGPERPLSLVSR